MTLRELMGDLAPLKLAPVINYGHVGETDAAFVSVFDTGNHNGPRFGYAVYMRAGGFVAKQTAPRWGTDAAASGAAEAELGPVYWYEKTPIDSEPLRCPACGSQSCGRDTGNDCRF